MGAGLRRLLSGTSVDVDGLGGMASVFLTLILLVSCNVSAFRVLCPVDDSFTRKAQIAR